MTRATTAPRLLINPEEEEEEEEEERLSACIRFTTKSIKLFAVPIHDVLLMAHNV